MESKTVKCVLSVHTALRKACNQQCVACMNPLAGGQSLTCSPQLKVIFTSGSLGISDKIMRWPKYSGFLGEDEAREETRAVSSIETAES